MSVTLSVFLQSSKLPSASAWAEAIRASGFALKLDATFDLRNASGFRPCEHEGHASGFEVFVGSASESVATNGLNEARLGARDLVVDLVMHSDMRELLCATLSAAVLCEMTGGLIWETEADEWITAANAIAWAREMEAVIRHELTSS